MEKFLGFLLKHSKTILVVFGIATVISMIASTAVPVNYNIMDYLPEDSPSTVALDLMDEQYTKGTPNARLMLPDKTIPEVLATKKEIQAIDGINEVTWLDDAANIYQPIEFIEKKTLEEYYKDGDALLVLTVDTDKQEAAIDKVREVAGEGCALSGTAVDSVTAIELTSAEINRIMVYVVLLVFLILMLTTTSWIEPVIFLVTIGVAIMINRGTNLLYGEISFVTNAAGSILQLAVSMDYSIFLLHRFAECREEEPDVTKAMTKAVMKSFGSIMSSGLTTVMGFAALILMRFKIGPDMGIIMAKAIAISLFCVMAFLPALALNCYKLIDKTQHKSWLPSFQKFGSFVLKIKTPMLILFLIVTIPSFMGQQYNSFTYGSSGIYGEGTQPGDETKLIEDTFGKSNLMVLMVPKGSVSTEKALCEELMAYDKVSSLVSYAETVGTSLPMEFVPKDTLSELISDELSRMIITVDTDVEGDEAFGMVEKVRACAQKYYGSSYYLVGETVNSYDLKDVVTADNNVVNAIAIGSIALILLFNFKSLTIPVLLLAVIESSIWINLTVPYFSGETLFYIGYLIISSIQLGATVDYAILFADRYIENRALMPKREAACRTLGDTALSILTSATILTSAGFMLGLFSSNGIISQLGILVGRGAVLSGVLVLFVLPALFYLCDGLIHKTTYKLNFYKEETPHAK